MHPCPLCHCSPVAVLFIPAHPCSSLLSMSLAPTAAAILHEHCLEADSVLDEMRRSGIRGRSAGRAARPQVTSRLVERG